MKRAAMVTAVSAFVLIALACDEKLRDVAGPTPELEPSFSRIQRDIFSSTDAAGRPACASCHIAANGINVANLNLVGAGAYERLVNVASFQKPGAIRVIPGDPNGSYLVQKIEGAPGIVGTRMPQNGPFLTPGQIAIIRRWIEIGAPNN